MYIRIMLAHITLFTRVFLFEKVFQLNYMRKNLWFWTFSEMRSLDSTETFRFRTS